jgi:hypothetical protein
LYLILNCCFSVIQLINRTAGALKFELKSDRLGSAEATIGHNVLPSFRISSACRTSFHISTISFSFAILLAESFARPPVLTTLIQVCEIFVDRFAGFGSLISHSIDFDIHPDFISLTRQTIPLPLTLISFRIILIPLISERHHFALELLQCSHHYRL